MRLMPNIVRLLAALSGIALAQDIASEAALPPGMTMEQARELAQKNGYKSSQSSVAATGPASSNSLDLKGEISPREGEIPASDTLDTTSRAAVLRKSRTPGKEKPKGPPPLQRYGRSVFESADPSLFASHVGAVGSGYVLGPGDEIILTLWGQKEARYQIALDRDGQANIEGIGVVSLNGLSLSAASDLLKHRMMRIYAGMGSGRVGMDLTLGKLKQIRVFVVGDVVKQGGYLLSGNTSVLAALFQAKGPSELGTEREVEVVRGKSRTKVDLYDYFFRGQKPVGDGLQDGDVVRVPTHGPLVAVRGDVGRPGVYELKGSEAAKEVLEYAGGILPTAAEAPVTALRIFENGRRDAVALPTPRSLLGGAVAKVQDGDTMIVARGQEPSSATVVVTGMVRFPGSFPIGAGKTAMDFIALAGGTARDAYTNRILLSRRLSDGNREQIRFSMETGASVAVLAQDSLWVSDVTELAWRDSVRISGAVRRPGLYSFYKGMTVKDLVLKAGGFLWGADWGNIRVETPVPGAAESKVEILALDSSLSSESADRVLNPRSHLAVPFDPRTDSLEMVEIRGWVARPGRYALQRSGERLSSFWERVGGLQADAYLSGARLIRNDGTGRIQIDFEKALSQKGSYDDLPLRAGDSIFIPMRPATVAVRGRVNSPANVVWREGKPWKWYIQQAGGYSDSADDAKVYVRFADGSVQTRDVGIVDKPNPGSEVIVPFKKPPEPTTAKDFLSGLNLVLGTAIAGLTIIVLLNK